MSYLNSILSAINTGQGASPSTGLSQSAVPSARQPVGRPPAVNGTGTTQAPKRKAEGDTGNATAKTARRDGQFNGVERYAGTARPSATPPVSRPSSTGPDNIPYRGTAKTATTSSSMAKPIAKPPAISTATPSTSRPSSKPSTPVSATAVAAPKPGSYLAMLARAKANQQTQPVVGAIKHKQTEKLTKRELLAQKAEAMKQQAANKRKQPVATNGRAGKLDTPGKAADVTMEKKRAVDLGYKGTMRPKAPEPSYTGTMRSGGASQPLRRPNGRDPRSKNTRDPEERARSYSDEDEEDYQSDASSDMEAGAFDLDAEENFSLRQARREDEEALREENELKRQKEMRKQSMQRLVEQANAKKKRY